MARDPALDDLEATCSDGNVVIFAGPGVSTAAGLPSRAELLGLLLARAAARRVDEERLHEIEALQCDRRLIDALSAAKEAVGAAEFCAVVERYLDDWQRDVPDVAEAIAGLEPRAVLTTNLDLLLERAFQGRWPALAHATGNIAQRRRFILKIFGTLMDRSTWVLTREEHERAAHKDPHLTSVFQGLFRTCPMLFVGCNPGADDFQAVLAWARDAAGEQPPTHWALFPERSVTRWVRTDLERLGLRPICHDGGDDAHAEVARILKELAASKQAHVPSTFLAPEAPTPRLAAARRSPIAPAPPPPTPPAVREIHAAPPGAIEDAIRQAKSRIQSLLEPIQGGAGIDVTYDESFEELKREVDKMESISGGTVDWERLVRGAGEILAEKSKDFRVAVFYAAAKAHTGGIAGALDGLVLIRELSAAFWDTMVPALRRPKARGNLCAWYGDIAAAAIGGHAPVARDAAVIGALDQVSRTVDAELRDKLGEAYTGISALRSAVRDLAQGVPKEAPPPPAAASMISFAEAFSVCPFQGPEPYGEDDAASFFGREAEINEALQRLGDTDAGRRHGLLIDGEPGVGKSSLVRAGLVPRAREGGWIFGAPEAFRAAVLHPGPEPIRGLAEALFAELHDRLPWTTAEPLAAELDASDAALADLLRAHVSAHDEGFFLALDPLEPLLEAHPRARARLEGLLVQALRDPDGPLYLVATLRTDALSQLGGLPALQALLEADARYTLGAISVPGLRAAIAGPAMAAGLRWEPGLLERIVELAEATSAPIAQIGALLRALWAHREGDLLTHEAYEMVGGVARVAVRP